MTEEAKNFIEAAILSPFDERLRAIQIIKQPTRIKPGSFPDDAQKVFDEAVQHAGFEAAVEALVTSAVMAAKGEIIKDIESGKSYEELAEEKDWNDESKGWTYYPG